MQLWKSVNKKCKIHGKNGKNYNYQNDPNAWYQMHKSQMKKYVIEHEM